ncbi:hypothetical protein FC753_04265 [Clostridium botulinum]|uniref:hypothetical protein n=1 Tax=Clostridium botulinum TaxID=1491 RepID=UPI0013F06A39|nr:hypothetical protein [Clostridium botulinum]MBN1061286.1 hypothetical protein [Clostridium botulinum]MCS6110739.1 hypothetical protein [Clostridium botulinum]NFE11269.1 hypothetical protein [Clostridium botulinum]
MDKKVNGLELSETNNSPKKMNKKRLIGIIVGILIICFLGGIVGVKINNANKIKKYHNDMTSVLHDMVNVGSDAETMTNVYSKIWNNSIEYNINQKWFTDVLGVTSYEFTSKVSCRNDLELYKNYNVIKGNFNQALAYVSEYYKNNGNISKINSRVNAIQTKVKALNNPPKGYENAYESLLKTYGSLESMCSYATSPNGSLISYNKDKKQVDDELLKNIKELEVRIPDIEK